MFVADDRLNWGDTDLAPSVRLVDLLPEVLDVQVRGLGRVG